MTSKLDKPSPLVRPTLQEAMQAIGGIAAQTLAVDTSERHRVTAEVSHMARIALEKLGDKEEITGRELEAVKGTLRAIQEAGHDGYIRAGGSQEDYGAIGRKLEKKPRARKPKG